jgi:hypothetical protein
VLEFLFSFLFLFGGNAMKRAIFVLSACAMLLWAPVAEADWVTATKVGDPIWTPADFHLFSAPIGLPSNGYADFIATLQGILPPPNHELHPNLGIGPGTPHAPPYDHEMADGVAAKGYIERNVFQPSDFAVTGNGVYLIWMTIPDPGTTGSSPDFTSGPIIPNSVFPLTVSYNLLRNGLPVYPADSSFPVPPLDNQLDPPFNVDGHSHFPFFLGESQEQWPEPAPTLGNYAFVVTMRDSQGNGWDMSAPFEVVPEPSTLLLAGFGLFGLVAYGCRRAVRKTS